MPAMMACSDSRDRKGGIQAGKHPTVALEPADCNRRVDDALRGQSLSSIAVYFSVALCASVLSVLERALTRTAAVATLRVLAMLLSNHRAHRGTENTEKKEIKRASGGNATGTPSFSAVVGYFPARSMTGASPSAGTRSPC